MSYNPNRHRRGRGGRGRGGYHQRGGGYDNRRGRGGYDNQRGRGDNRRGRGGYDNRRGRVGYDNRRGRGGYDNRRGRGGRQYGGSGCYKCGQQGHFARDCRGGRGGRDRRGRGGRGRRGIGDRCRAPNRGRDQKIRGYYNPNQNNSNEAPSPSPSSSLTVLPYRWQKKKQKNENENVPSVVVISNPTDETIAVDEPAQFVPETKFKNQAKQALKSWFDDVLNLPEYYKVFVEAGYKNLDYLDANINEDELINDIRITNKPHRKKILQELKILLKNRQQKLDFEAKTIEQTTSVAEKDKLETTDICDNNETDWIWCSYSESQQCEGYLNAENKQLENNFASSLGSFRRVTIFEGNVIVVTQNEKMGFVQPNYPQENKGVGIAFYYSDFINEDRQEVDVMGVRKGYKLEYSLQFDKPQQVYKVVNIKIISRNESNSAMCITSAQLNLNESRYVDKVKQINKPPQTSLIFSTHLKQLIPFNLNECNFNAIDIENDCYVEYCVQNLTAIGVAFIILDYTWKEKINEKWKYCPYEQCVEYENTYNQNHSDIETELNLDDKCLKRYKRFKGKIKRLNPDKRMGYVEYRRKYNVLFESNQCDFDTNFLSEGDMISYKIERDEDANGVPIYKCLDVKFLPITFLWREKSASDDEWTNCSVQRSKELESKYSKTWKQNKNRDIVDNASKKRFCRTITLRGQISSDTDGKIKFNLDDNYQNIKVDIDREEYKIQSFNEGDEIEFKLINTEKNVCKAVDLRKLGESNRKCGILTRIDMKKKIGYVKPFKPNIEHDEKNNNEYEFSFYEFIGAPIERIPIDTKLEYELRYFSNAQPKHKATRLCLYLLPYQWLIYDDESAKWKQQSIDTSKLLEKSHENITNKQLKIDDDINMRVERFQRTVKEINCNNNRGLVEINYNNEIRNVCFPFYFEELKFDPKYLQKGDEIIYELKKQNHPKPHWRVINIQFGSLIPFYWMALYPGKYKWFNVPFRQNFVLENKYNKSNDVQFEKPITDPHSSKKYRRHSIFRGKLISLPTEHKPGNITVFYDTNFDNLCVDVEGKQQEFDKNSQYTFNIVPNESGLAGFKAINMQEKITYNKQIFKQRFESKLLDIDEINKTGKLEIPSKLVTLLGSNDKIQNAAKYVPFDFFQCKGILSENVIKLNKNCILQFSIITNKKHKKDDVKSDASDDNDEKEEIDFPFKASNIGIPMIYYRWQKYDESNKRWKAMSREISVQYEKVYNKEHKDISKVIPTQQKERIRRITRFKGQILKIDTVSQRAQVRINYSKEYGEEIGVWFNFSDCKFAAKYLQINDDVEYNLRQDFRAINAVNVKLWLIPFKYIYNKDADNTDYDKWNEFTYHKCRDLEEKFNPNGGDDCKDFDYEINNELVRVKRIKTFQSKAIIDWIDNRKQCYLPIFYLSNRNLEIRIPYPLTNNNLNIRHDSRVTFGLKRDLQSRRWEIINIEKIKYENKQVLLLKQQNKRENKQVLLLQQQIQQLEKEKYEKYISELDYSWKKKRMTNWTNEEIVDWIKCMNLGAEINGKICDVIINNECAGEDIQSLETVKDVSDAFDLSGKQKLCQTIVKEIQNFKPKLKRVDTFNINFGENFILDEEFNKSDTIFIVKTRFKNQNCVDFEIKHIHFRYKNKELFNLKTLEQCGIVDDKHLIDVQMDDVFSIHVFAQGDESTLATKVSETYTIGQIKEMYQNQSGVCSDVSDIHFKYKKEELLDDQTLKQCGIVDDKHLITVRFGTDGGGE